MRLTYILAATAVATFHASATAFPSVKDSKAAIENGAVSGIVNSNLAGGGRLLRRVDNNDDDLNDDDLDGNDDLDDDDLDDSSDLGDDDLDDSNDLDDDDLEEERTLGDVLKKLNPATAVKKTAQSVKHSANIKKMGDYHNMLEKSKKLVYNN